MKRRTPAILEELFKKCDIIKEAWGSDSILIFIKDKFFESKEDSILCHCLLYRGRGEKLNEWMFLLVSKREHRAFLVPEVVMGLKIECPSHLTKKDLEEYEVKDPKNPQDSDFVATVACRALDALDTDHHLLTPFNERPRYDLEYKHDQSDGLWNKIRSKFSFKVT